MENFKAFRVFEENSEFNRKIVERSINDLPEGDVTIQVVYSSINYKDALSSIGNRGVTRKYPHTPGIDAAGLVLDSNDEKFSKGEEVFITGYDLGMNTDGGFGQLIRVPGEWIIKKPQGLTLKESMIYGTAGFTAALSVYRLAQEVSPDEGKVLVTGGTGSVANIAMKILVKLGYDVIVATGKVEKEKESLMKLGVEDVIHRKEIEEETSRPMVKSRWSGVIDTVGGSVLTSVIKAIQYGGAVTTCGNVGGASFESSVYPFILRGITLFGIDSVQCPMDLRLVIWDKLQGEWKPETLDEMVQEVELEKLENVLDKMIEGKKTGRYVVKL